MARKRRKKKQPESILPPMKLWVWLGLALALVAMLLGGAFYLDGLKFFRDIEYAETLIYVGWAVVAVFAILVPAAIKSLAGEEKKEEDRA